MYRKIRNFIIIVSLILSVFMVLSGCDARKNTSVTAPKTTGNQTKPTDNKTMDSNKGGKPEVEMVLKLPDSQAYDGALKDTLSQIGNKTARVDMPIGRYILNESHEIPENVTINIQKGACFDLDRNATLTINGTIHADASHIFQGEGSVAGNIGGDGYVQWFGADKSDGGDHTEFFQKALDACSVVLIPDRVEGYSITALEIKKPVIFKGIGTNRVNLKIIESPINYHITIASSDVRIENITIKSIVNLTQKNKIGLYFNTAAGSFENIAVKNVNIDDIGFGIADSMSKENTLKNIQFETVNINSNRNTGVHFFNFTTGISLKNVCVSSFGPDVPAKGYVFENVKDMWLENVDVLGGYEKTGGKTGDGMTFLNCENVRCYRLMIDYVSGRQLVIKDSRNFKFSNFVTSLVKLDGIYLENFTDSEMNVIKTNGIYNNDTPIMMMKNCSGLVFNDLIVQLSKNDGLVVENCTGNTFNNLVISETAGKALIETGGGGNVYNGVITRSNGGGISIESDKTEINGYISAAGSSAHIKGQYSD